MGDSLTIISSSLSNNAMSRAYTLAMLLGDCWRVRIVGIDEGKEIWEPVRFNAALDVAKIPAKDLKSLLRGSERHARRHFSGDLIVAVKPLQRSFGIALAVRRTLDIPLLLDIDDWEVGFLCESPYREFRSRPLNWLFGADSSRTTRQLEAKVREADAVTVTNTFLHTRFGGHIIGQPRDEAIFCPTHFPSPSTVRQRDRVVLFLGTARRHKGLDELLAAWRLVRSKNARLHIIGNPEPGDLAGSLGSGADLTVSFGGLIPFSKVPETISKADLVVIPQLAKRGSVGQLPMKLIDAMALQKPIISTCVGDIPLWLGDGAGAIVAAGDVRSLARTIDDLLANPEHCDRMALRARQRFLARASFKAVRPMLHEIVDAMLQRRAADCSAFELFSKSEHDVEATLNRNVEYCEQAHSR